MREMEKEAALEMEGLPNSMELFSPSKVLATPRTVSWVSQKVRCRRWRVAVTRALPCLSPLHNWSTCGIDGRPASFCVWRALRAVSEWAVQRSHRSTCFCESSDAVRTASTTSPPCSMYARSRWRQSRELSYTRFPGSNCAPVGAATAPGPKPLHTHVCGRQVSVAPVQRCCMLVHSSTADHVTAP
jgi:hypothetical protein